MFEPDNLQSDTEIGQYFTADPKYQELEDKELLKKLEDRSFLDDITNSEEWRIFREAWYRMYKQADQLLTECKPTDVATIAFAQASKRFYRDVIGNTIRLIKVDGDIAIQELKRMNKLSVTKTKIKKSRKKQVDSGVDR